MPHASKSDSRVLHRRQLPKLMACMTKTSLENMRNKALFSLNVLDAKGIRRRKLPLHECIILELREAGFTESSDYFQDLIYDNMQLVAEDDIGIVVDLRNRPDYLEDIASILQKAENHRDKGETKKECIYLLDLALDYAEKGKGILWLAEKFYMAAIAVGSQYLIDGGRQKGCCKFHYAKFLLDKFPGANTDEPYNILTEVRDTAIGKGVCAIHRCVNFPKSTLPFVETKTEMNEAGAGKLVDVRTLYALRKAYQAYSQRISSNTWPLYEPPENEPDKVVRSETLFKVTAIQLHRVLLSKARSVLKTDPAKAERLSRLAERRAKDADETDKTAEAIIEIGICQLAMNNLNNAQRTFEKAFKIHSDGNNIQGLCETRMHMAAVMQRLGDHEAAADLLTKMGAMAMEYGLRRHLGRALHLLGELHLRRERPDLGTQHLQEAFGCFMGTNIPHQNIASPSIKPDIPLKSTLDMLYHAEKTEIYEQEAEQSRLMMAISAGQENMASYFNLLREAAQCSVAKIKIIEWKLSNTGWWHKREHHNFIPCMCPLHNRSPLDILRMQLDDMKKSQIRTTSSDGNNLLMRMETIEDIQKLRSTTNQ